MKQIIMFFLLCTMVQMAFATNVIKAPGSTTDVFSELTNQNILNADTLFIEGGFGDIYLKAGSVDDGTPYYWDIGTGSLTSYQVTFTYTHATNTLTDGSKGFLISVSRSNPVQAQYVWVVYRDLALKPSAPAGDTSICAGTSTGYTSTSTNANSYEWYINPGDAGTLIDETTGNVTVNWSASWTGNASLTVKGVKDGDKSPLSDPLIIEVGDVPDKPVISGSGIVEKGSVSIYTVTTDNANSWDWLIDPTPANFTPNGNEITIEYTDTALFTLTVQASNTCGNSLISDGFEINIVDLRGMQTHINQLLIDTTNQGIMYREIITNLDAEKEFLQGLVDSLELEIAVLEASNITLQNQITNLTADNVDLQEQVDNLTFVNDSLLIQLDFLTADNTDLLEQVNYLTLDNNSLQEMVDSLVPVIDNLQEQVDNLIVENTDILEQIDNLNINNDDLLFQVDSLIPVITYLQEQVDYLTSDNAGLQIQVDTLTIDIEELGVQVDILTADNIDLQEQIDSLIPFIVDLQEQVDNLSATNAGLLEQVDELTANNQSLQILVDDLITTNNILQEKVVELEVQVEILSRVYILSWEVEEVTTRVFETEIGNFSISLYPNPSPGEVFISCTEEIKEVKILNLQGLIIKQLTVNSSETSFIMNRDEMPVGTYLVHIKTGLGNSIHRIVFL